MHQPAATFQAEAPARPGPSSELILYRQAASLAGMGAWSCDLVSDRLTWTSGVFDLFGIAQDSEVSRQDIVAMYAEESRARMERLRSRAIATGTGFTMEARIRRTDGQERWMRLIASTLHAGNRSVTLYGMKQDITQERREREHLRRLAESDALTGLANRHRFQAEFLDRRRDAPAASPLGALVLFDLDDFKAVNDRWGHAAGDACLTTFAQRLRAFFPQASLIARIGGDEFAMLLPPAVPLLALERQVRRRMPSLCTPAVWTDRWLPMGASAGMATPPSAICFDAEALYAAADRALYRAKGAGTQKLFRAEGAGL